MGFTRADAGLLLGLTGFLMGGAACFLAFKASQTAAGFESTLETDGTNIDTLLNETKAQRESVAGANKRVSALTHDVTAEFGDVGEAWLRAALALCDQGRREGIEMLIELADPKRRTLRRWASVQAAAHRLNDIAGQRIYAEEEKGDPETTVLAAAESAAPEFRKWWDRVKKSIRFDAASRTWIAD